MKYNSVKYGFIISTVLPLALFAVVFCVKFHDYERPLENFLILYQIPKLFSLCVFPNGLIFYYYITKNKLLTMRGMVAGTVVMAVIMLILFALCR
ncbi:MAG: hypothetical protein LBC98_10120 [Prevotellaceae bacterium]|nr:hypothetical protein [Prevotellaceae bacterium]